MAKIDIILKEMMDTIALLREETDALPDSCQLRDVVEEGMLDLVPLKTKLDSILGRTQYAIEMIEQAQKN